MKKVYAVVFKNEYVISYHTGEGNIPKVEAEQAMARRSHWTYHHLLSVEELAYEDLPFYIQEELDV